MARRRYRSGGSSRTSYSRNRRSYSSRAGRSYGRGSRRSYSSRQGRGGLQRLRIEIAQPPAMGAPQMTPEGLMSLFGKVPRVPRVAKF